MWVIIILAIVAFVVYKVYKQKAEDMEIEKDKQARAAWEQTIASDMNAKKSKCEVLTEAEKNQLLKLEGEKEVQRISNEFSKAKNGNSGAMVNVATAYYSRIKNNEKSAYWMYRAMKAGNSTGTYYFGYYCMLGCGVAKNYDRGLDLVIDAAQKGNKQAINYLLKNGGSVEELRAMGIPI